MAFSDFSAFSPQSSSGSPSSALPPEAGRGTPPRWPAWLRVVAALACFSASAWSPLLLMLVPGFPELVDRGSAVASLLAYAGLATMVLACYVGLSMVLVRWVDRRPVRALGLRLDRRGWVALAAGTGLAVAAAVLVGLGVLALGGQGPQAGSLSAELGRASRELGMPAAVVLAVEILRMLIGSFVHQGIGEEVVMRGYLLQSLSGRPRAAVWVSAAAFTVLHLMSQGGQEGWVEHLLYLTTPFGFAVSAAYLAILTRSVWAAVGIHGGFHVGTWVMVLMGVSGDVQESPAMWVAMGAVHLLVGLALARRITPGRWAEVAARGPYAAPGAERP